MTLGMTIMIILSIVLIGGALASAYGAARLFTEDLSDSWMMGGLLVALALILTACELGAVMLYRYESGPTFELLKSEWACTSSQVVQDDEGDSTICNGYSRR